MDASTPPDPVPAITRAVAVLDILAQHGSQGLPVSAVARELNLARSSTANICAALEATGLVVRSGGHHRLGHRLLEFGGKYLSTIDQVRLFYDLCQSSPHVAAETARLALLDGADVVYLARYDGSQPLRLTASIGDRYPATVTATGKAMLATRTDDEVSVRLQGVTELPRLTDSSISSMPALFAELAETRRRGWAVDDEETTPGVCCFAVAIADREAAPASFAISVTVEKRRATDDIRAHLLGDLRRIAEQLTTPLYPYVRRATTLGGMSA